MEVKRSIITKYKLSLPMIIFSGILFLILAWKMDANAGPDEFFRYKVTEWIAAHNALPTGFEEEIIDSRWCFSYAFTPYLPSILAVLFVKTVSVFTSNPQVLLFAARLVNVFAGMGAILVSFRIGDKLLDNKSSVYFFAGVTAYLPQFTFLSGYLNNDVLNLLSAFMILDAVLTGAKGKWTLKNMIYLSVGTGICMLTYYFGYGWVLFAVAGYFYTSFKTEKDRKKIFKKAGIIALFVFILAGWYFVRNGIIYHGDFLGYRAQNECVSEYSSKYGIIAANNPGVFSMHLRDMLHNGRWIETTHESFIGMFGGMVICLDGKFYDFYTGVFWLCVLFFCLYRYKTKDKISTPFLMMLLFEIAFPIAFSVFSSYVRDYQPQGRYIISILPALAVITAVGMDEWSKAVCKKYRFGKYLPAVSTVVLLLVFAVIYYTVMLPTLTFIYLPGADRVLFYYIR